MPTDPNIRFAIFGRGIPFTIGPIVMMVHHHFGSKCSAQSHDSSCTGKGSWSGCTAALVPIITGKGELKTVSG